MFSSSIMKVYGAPGGFTGGGTKEGPSVEEVD
jgi:hypothetical protein